MIPVAWTDDSGRRHTSFEFDPEYRPPLPPGAIRGEAATATRDAWDVDGYKRLEDAGVTHILTMPWPFYHGETDDLDKKIDGVKRYADDIISRFSA